MSVKRLIDFLAALPVLLGFLTDREIGESHGVGFRAKLRLYLRMRANTGRLETLSNVREHLELAGTVLRIPPSMEGVVVECGCYLGGSSANLSLVCALTRRRLVIYDSFQGLPEPSRADRLHVNLHSGVTDEYYEGRFAATLDAVRANIARCGVIGVCDFVPGFFEETLGREGDTPARDEGMSGRGVRRSEPVVMAFLDVDLVDSLRPCLQGLWPRLQDGCRIYAHEARSLRLVSTFFDSTWWEQTFAEDPPGFVGAGTGLPLTAPYGSELGYARKGSPAEDPAGPWADGPAGGAVDSPAGASAEAPQGRLRRPSGRAADGGP